MASRAGHPKTDAHKFRGRTTDPQLTSKERKRMDKAYRKFIYNHESRLYKKGMTTKQGGMQLW